MPCVTQTIERPTFVGLNDYQWSALSAISTLLAVLVALGVPFLLKWLDRRAAAARLLSRYRELTAAVYEALNCLIGALEDFNRGRMTGTLDLTRAAARASSRAQTLRILATSPGISDGAIASCVSAARALEFVVQAHEAHRRAAVGLVAGELEAGLAIAKEAAARIQRVAAYREINFPDGRTVPALPDSYLDPR